MIYPFVRVPLPDLSGFIQPRNGVRYFFAYVGPRKVTKSGKSTHPASKMIGRIETNAEGVDELMPNENYFMVMGLPKPDIAVAEGAGRKPEVRDVSPEKQKKGAERSFGYGFVAANILAESGATTCLEKAFGKEDAQKISAIACYLCEGNHSSFADLNDFIKENLILNCPSSFDRRRAGELLVQLTSDKRNDFYTNWIDWHKKEVAQIFYDVTSFSTYSGQILRAEYGYNRDGEDLRQLNQGLFCSRETQLPMYMCSYEGSLNDAQNFKYALQQAKDQHLFKNDKKLTIVMDGGFSRENFNWAHMEGYNLIAGVSPRRLKAVKEKYLAWARSLKLDDFSKEFDINDSLYISHREPIMLAGVEGELVMYIDLTSQSDRKKTDHSLKKKKEAELKSLSHWPGKDFDNWAKSFEPYFTVTRAKGPKGFTYEENKEGQAISNALCGAVTLFTTCNKMTDQEIMAAYRSKESVEDCFDTTKNGLCDKRLHVQGDAQVDGKMFAMFIGLILRRYITNRLKDWMHKNKFTFHDVVKELKKIRFTKMGNGKWTAKDAFTKIQKQIIDELDLICFRQEDLTVHPRVRKTAKKGS